MVYILNILPSSWSFFFFVTEHNDFVTVSYGGKLKISLILNSSLVQLFYTPASDPSPRLLLDKGEFTTVIKILQKILSLGFFLSIHVKI